MWTRSYVVGLRVDVHGKINQHCILLSTVAEDRRSTLRTAR